MIRAAGGSGQHHQTDCDPPGAGGARVTGSPWRRWEPPHGCAVTGQGACRVPMTRSSPDRSARRLSSLGVSGSNAPAPSFVMKTPPRRLTRTQFRPCCHCDPALDAGAAISSRQRTPPRERDRHVAALLAMTKWVGMRPRRLLKNRRRNRRRLSSAHPIPGMRHENPPGRLHFAGHNTEAIRR